jgi:hypothetical protein
VLAYELNKKIEAMLGDAVAEGKVVEVQPPTPENTEVTDYEEVGPSSNGSPKLSKK